MSTIKNIKDIRYSNFLLILRRFATLKEYEQQTGLSANFASQLNTRQRNIGDKYARKIETALGLQKNSLDTTNGVLEPRQHYTPTATPQQQLHGLTAEPAAPGPYDGLPQLTWEHLAAQPSSAVNGSHTMTKQKGRFILIVADNSMTPEFTQGMEILIDPSKPARTGDYVIATPKNGAAAKLRQYRNEAGIQRLYALVDRYPDAIEECGEIIGPVIWKRLLQNTYK